MRHLTVLLLLAALVSLGCAGGSGKEDARAQYELGYTFEQGEKVTRDLDQAEKWYRKSAEQGYVEAQYALANLLIEVDVGSAQEAADWYRKAAAQGHLESQYNLAVMYDFGEGIARDTEEAIKWYRQAAEQGFRDAQYNLGVLYLEGAGVPADGVLAAKWLRRAAAQADADAQYRLGQMYTSGLGSVPPNPIQAYVWLRRAERNEQPEAEAAREEIEATMSPEQLAEAKRLAVEH